MTWTTDPAVQGASGSGVYLYLKPFELCVKDNRDQGGPFFSDNLRVKTL